MNRCGPGSARHLSVTPLRGLGVGVVRCGPVSVPWEYPESPYSTQVDVYSLFVSLKMFIHLLLDPLCYVPDS